MHINFLTMISSSCYHVNIIMLLRKSFYPYKYINKKFQRERRFLQSPKNDLGGICYTIHQYVKANNKYMKDYDIFHVFLS